MKERLDQAVWFIKRNKFAIITAWVAKALIVYALLNTDACKVKDESPESHQKQRMELLHKDSIDG